MSSEGSASADLVGVKPEGVREFTVRAGVVAFLVAVIMGASYPYIVLKLGFGPNVSVVAAFFGYLFLGIFVKGFNRWENNIVQTAGTSAAQTAFMCILLAAFDMLAARNPAFTLRLSPLQSFLWLTTASVLGVLLAVPLRRHYIVDEKLTYADGVAAGETLIVLDSKGTEGRKAAVAMGIGTAASALYMAVREEGLLLLSLAKWALPDQILLGPKLIQKMGVGFSWSLLSLGSGMLVGVRINASMMLGGLLSWVVGVLALTALGWVPEAPTKVQVLFWVMWPATGMLIAGGMTALALKWKVLARSFSGLTGAQVGSSELPMKVVLGGAAACTVVLMVIQQVNLGVPWWVTLLATIASVPLMLVGLRVLGETNWGPISSLSNMMQGVFAVIVPGSLSANMVASGTTGTIASSSEGIIQDYKAGHMIGSTPKYLAYAQLAAVPVGAAAVAWIYPLLRDTYGIVGETAKLSSPASARWAGFAEILQGGVDALPPHALTAMGIFAALGVLFTVLEENKAIKPFVPSPTGVGIGMLVPFAVVSTMFVGGLMGFAWEKADKKTSDSYAAPLASGLIAGEAILAVIVPALVALKLLPMPG
ncbi:MAG: OPT/YSL family transporter [Myxococcaceae bacterium]|nr:OPT/YSL family transporter [Myxococcaceae bacterium]